MGSVDGDAGRSEETAAGGDGAEGNGDSVTVLVVVGTRSGSLGESRKE